ncbi:MAG: T9SS type A sorting domain-containing protein, partial [Candidatus Zixiibacteriota bacterium]
KGIFGPFKKFLDIELAPYETRSAHFDQHVNSQAPLGVYNYIGYCGDWPSTVTDSSFFEVEVTSAVFSDGQDVGWVLTGSFDKGDDLASIPSEFALHGNCPNPFNARTEISYQLPVDSHVKLEVYNLLGQKVATLIDEKQQAGYRSVLWDASDVSSGLYFYKLTAGDFTETRRMMLVK